MPAPPVVLLMTSNGVGMGHLSRQLTIALSGAHRFDTVVFSLSGALPRVVTADRDGELPEAADRSVRYEYCPSRESGWLPPAGWQRRLRQRYRSYRWHPYLRDRLVALASETGASTVVFDGVVPYDGLLRARRLLPDVAFTWVRRGMWRPDAPKGQLAAAAQFDLVLEPGDWGGAADRGPLRERSDALPIPPISMTDVLAASSRASAREALGLPPDRPVLLLAPGSGALGSVEESSRRVRQRLAELAPDWVVAVTRQAIAQHQVGADTDAAVTTGPATTHLATTHPATPDVVVLDDVYPLARHLAAFDAAVSAAGYNAVHELLGAGVPTLFLPSTHHVTDDQAARTQGVADRGAALSAEPAGLEEGLTALLDPQVRADLRQACATVEPAVGGRVAAAQVADLAGSAAPAAVPLPRPAPAAALLDARTRTGGRGEPELRFLETVTTADVRGSDPVEHLLPGSSGDYRTSRERTAGWLYRTV